MKYFNLILSVALSLLLLSSCMIRVSDKFGDGPSAKASGVSVTKTYDFESISSIAVELANIEFTQSDSVSVEFECDEAILEHYTVTDTNGDIRFDCDLSKLSGNPLMIVRISAPQIDKFVLEGSSDLAFMNGYKSDSELEISLNGSGDVKGSDIAVSDLNLAGAGACDVDLSAVQCKSINMAIAGSGDIVIKNLDAENIDCSIAGAGDITVTGKADHAEVVIAGAGDVDFSGLYCVDIDSSIKGIGKVKRMDD